LSRGVRLAVRWRRTSRQRYAVESDVHRKWNQSQRDPNVRPRHLSDKEHDREWHRIRPTSSLVASPDAACRGWRAARDRGRLLRLGLCAVRAGTGLPSLFRLLRGAAVLRLLQHLLAIVAGGMPALPDLRPRSANRSRTARQCGTRSDGTIGRTAPSPASRPFSHSRAAAGSHAAGAAGGWDAGKSTYASADERSCVPGPHQLSTNLDRSALHGPAAAVRCLPRRRRHIACCDRRSTRRRQAACTGRILLLA
jgi:hypothetical protein